MVYLRWRALGMKWWPEQAMALGKTQAKILGCLLAGIIVAGAGGMIVRLMRKSASTVVVVAGPAGAGSGVQPGAPDLRVAAAVGPTGLVVNSVGVPVPNAQVFLAT